MAVNTKYYARYNVYTRPKSTRVVFAPEHAVRLAYWDGATSKIPVYRASDDSLFKQYTQEEAKELASQSRRGVRRKRKVDA